MNTARDVLQFWFGDVPGERRKAWFVKDPAFDAEIRARFLGLHEAAARGELAGWKDAADSALALIVLTDQFPRNMFRGEARAFATDPIALAIASNVIANGWDAGMRPVERMFVYLPYEHSEVLTDQEKSLRLFEPLGAFEATKDTPDFARRHWEIVKRFGRFPHRNAALGRPGTPEETEFLKQPGSGF
ncbi:MAG: DUF924 domain-containing protein [Proteobacteria bacterium]|nr:DUF924 domain-containing protein [Pseudomonadota bacterium]